MYKDIINFSAAIDLINSSRKIIITTHTNPDGDAVGSSLAIYYYLKDKDKDVSIIIDGSECPLNYSFLKSSEKIQRYDSAVHNSLINVVDLIIITDLNDLSRTRSMEFPILNSPAKKILIDHHLNYNYFSNVTLSFSDLVATGEIVFNLLKFSKTVITKNIAEALYTSIYTDSGGFRFKKTSSNTLKIASELINSGADPVYIYDKIYNTCSINKLKLHGLAMSKIETFCDSKLSIMCITKKMFDECGAAKVDTEDLSNVLLSLVGSKIGALIIEMNDNEFRVSLRSKEEIDIGNVAQYFGGGGHINAAGCHFFNMNIEEVKKTLIQELGELI